MLGAIIPAGSALVGHRTKRALRFNDDDTPGLGRVPGVAPTSAKRLTINVDLKRGNLSTGGGVICEGATGASSSDVIEFYNSGDSDRLCLFLANLTYYIITTRRFRDPNAWFNLHAEVDTPNATAADRLQIWIDGVRETAFDAAAYPPQNYDMVFWNASGVQQYIGRHWSGLHFDGYLAEFHMVDGQALPPTAFGAVNPATGEWERKPYTGTYGANGYQLLFEDNSNTTAATLGKDTSGNINNFTPANLSVTAGVGNDSLTDTPTPYDDGTLHGNFATLSPLTKFSAVTLANGNLEISSWGGSQGGACSNFAMKSGKWYCEATNVGQCSIGIARESSVGPTLTQFPGFAGYGADNAFGYNYAGQKCNGGIYAAYGATYTTADILGVAFDADSGTLEFFKNGVSQGVAFSGISMATGFVFVVGYWATSPGLPQFNFGQRPFSFTPPTGFKALCAQNLPDGETIITSGSFAGNASADGPVVDIRGVPATLSIDGNAVTFGTHADRLSNGFKLRTASSPYNQAGTRNWAGTGTIKRKYARAK